MEFDEVTEIHGCPITVSYSVVATPNLASSNPILNNPKRIKIVVNPSSTSPISYNMALRATI